MTWSKRTRQLVQAACEEDLGTAGDITSALLPGDPAVVTARVVPRQTGVICGLALGSAICEVFSDRLGAPLALTPARHSGRDFQDGDAVAPGVCAATLRGPQAVVLTVERTVLNFLGRMSGVATLTRRFVDAARQTNPHVQILDTRKTIPGWRELDKYSVRAGGGQNHRFGLYDAVLIKDNHLAGIPTDRLADALRGLLSKLVTHKRPAASAVGNAHAGAPAAAPSRPGFIEIEVDDLAQFRAVCQVPDVDIALLDNFTLDDMRAAVEYRDNLGLRSAQRTLLLEASGGVTLDTVADIAATGIDRISVGALTHSAFSLDIGLDL